jgi:hypothetical protein
MTVLEGFLVVLLLAAGAAVLGAPIIQAKVLRSPSS